MTPYQIGKHINFRNKSDSKVDYKDIIHGKRSQINCEVFDLGSKEELSNIKRQTDLFGRGSFEPKKSM